MDPATNITYEVRWGQDEGGRLVAIEAVRKSPRASDDSGKGTVFGQQPSGEGLLPNSIQGESSVNLSAN